MFRFSTSIKRFVLTLIATACVLASSGALRASPDKLPPAKTATAPAVVPIDEKRASQELYQHTMPAMAWVISPVDDKLSMTGTGVVVDAEKKLVLTAYHIVQERDQVVVFFPVEKDHKYVLDGDYYVKNHLWITGKVVARDAKKDLAVIQVETLPVCVKAVPLAKVSPEVDETVHVVGNSGHYDNSLWRYREGMVKKVGAMDIGTISARMFETEVGIDHGDSGGPVLNKRGELVGITSTGDPNHMLCRSISIEEIRGVLGEAKAPAASADFARHEEAIRETNDLFRNLTDNFRTVNDRASARKAALRIKPIVERLQELDEAQQRMVKMTEDETRAINDRYVKELTVTFGDYFAELDRIRAIPEAASILKDLVPFGKDRL